MLDRFLRTDHKAVEKNEPVSKVLGWLRNETKQPPVILDGKLPYGIPNKMSLTSSRLNDSAAVLKYTRPTPRLYEESLLFDALAAFSESLANYLPVTKENDTLAGYLRAIDIAREVDAPLTAGEMAQRVPVMRPDEWVGRAIKVFREHPADHLPVADAEGDLVGVLPRHNILDIELGRLQSQGTGDRASDNDPLQRNSVHDFMEDGAIQMPPDEDYAGVLDTLEKTGYAVVNAHAPGKQANVQGILLPEYVVRAVRPHHQTPRSGSTHGAGIRKRR